MIIYIWKSPLTCNREIVIYRGTSPLSLVIGHQSQEKKTSTSSYIIYFKSYGKPDYKDERKSPNSVHNGPKETYPVSGNVRFRALKTSDIKIPQTSQGSPLSKSKRSSNQLLACVELAKKGALTSDIHSFSLYIPPLEGTLRGSFE
jgi:hypothetical protein